MIKSFLTNIYLTAISIIINFAFKAYLANIATKAVLATFYTALDVINLFFILFIGARSSMIVAYNKTKDDTNILNLFRISLIIVFFLAWGFMLPFVKHQLNLDIAYLYLIFMFFSFGIYVYFLNQLGMYKLYKAMNVITILEPLLLVGWFSLAYFGYSLNIIHSLVISTIMTYLNIAIYIFISKTNKEPPLKKVEFTTDIKTFVKNSSFASVEFIFSMLTIYISVYLFAKYFSLADLADYQVVVKSIYMYYLALFVFPIFRFVMPQLAQHFAKKEYDQIEKIKLWVLRYALVVGIATFVIIQLFGYYLTIKIFSYDYINAVYLLEAISISFFFAIFNAFYNSYIKSFGGFKITMIIKGVSIAVFIAIFFGLYAIKKEPIVVIYALNLSHIIQSVMFLVVAKRYQNNKISLSK
jgi:O-antigen/teichoic acid export membrane protein